MRVNEYNSLEEFTSQYTGCWGPSEGHWLGLDFLYNGNEYRLQTGSMFNSQNTILDDGREALFGLYQKIPTRDKRFSPDHFTYTLLEEYADMDSLLTSTVIEHRLFREIIMDDTTELIGQD